MDLQGRGIYRQHRIHTTRLVSGLWVAAVVRLGASLPPGQGHAGPPVEHLRGEHPSEVEAIAAARDYLDRQATDSLSPSAHDPENPRAMRKPSAGPAALGDLFEAPRGEASA